MGIPQHSINAGRAVPNARDHGQEVIFEAGGAITAGALVYSSASSGGRPTVTVADDDAFRASSDSSLWVAIHAAASGQQVRCAKYRVLYNVDTSAGALGGAVYLSDTGGWSHAAGTVRKRVGTFLADSATVGVVELAPQASFASETVGGIFVSAEITGSGSGQSTAHGLGRIPSKALAVVSDNAGTGVAWTAAPGSHTNANAIFTVTNSVKYYIIAF
tara:strand:+ start:222 stop:872 length:651 start_codon:yes stop_codon:yes gene_type:complete